MKLICAKCGERFSVRKEQLGKRGKCPNCRATITIPRSRQAVTTAYDPVDPPSRWLEHTFSVTIAVAAHLLVLGLLAMVPWTLARRGIGGEGIEIVLGQAPARPQADLAPDELQQTSLQDLPRLTESLVPTETRPADLTGMRQPVSALSIDLYAGSSSSSAPMQMTDITGSQIPTGGRIEFELFLQELKKEGLDIAITFDSTGSMQGEIDQVKSQIERIGKILQRLIPSVRISICTYRDSGDEYVVKGLPLTENLGEVVGFLSGIRAAGGGDEPEAVDEGLRWVIENNQFRDSARKVILLFGDAPPHYDRQTECLQLASDFRRHGGIVSTVTCRQERQSIPLAEIAQIGGGESFLTSDDQQIVARLVVLVFGSQYEDRVLELFELSAGGE